MQAQLGHAPGWDTGTEAGACSCACHEKEGTGRGREERRECECDKAAHTSGRQTPRTWLWP